MIVATLPAPEVGILYSEADERDVTSTVHFCYAHGKAEEFMFHDILISVRPTGFQPGVHEVTLENPEGERKKALLFVWAFVDNRLTHGLCVLPDDPEGLAKAAQCYVNKDIAI